MDSAIVLGSSASLLLGSASADNGNCAFQQRHALALIEVASEPPQLGTSSFADS
jgi:hypothetical protein